MQRALILLARAPWVPGKSRLTAGLPVDAADALRRALLLDTFEAIATLDTPIIVAFTPTDARGELEWLLDRPGTAYLPQRGTDLGSRMANALDDAFARGVEYAVLVGSDLPTLPPSHVAAAIPLLESGRDLVLGPSEDGGFYLIGMRGSAREYDVFSGIEWGTADVLAQTLLAAERLGLDVALVPPWYDVDTPVDLRRATRDAPENSGQKTRDWIERFGV